MSRWWRWFLPGYVATLPYTLVALAYSLWRGGHSWQWRDGYLTFISSRLIGNPGGQCWSPVIGFADEEQRSRTDLHVHELTHVVQVMALSSLAPLLVWLWALADLPWAWTPIGIFAPVVDVLWFALSAAPFAVLYGAMFGAYYVTEQKDEQPGWHDDYLRNPFERHAYAVQARYQTASPAYRATRWGHR